MRNLIIIRGLPGSGKSTAARMLADINAGIALSTDNYWLRPDGRYDFNAALLKEAHAWNQSQCEKCMVFNETCVVVDNTNVRLMHMKPYFELAQAYNYDASIMYTNNPWSWDVDECAKRNTHNVPRDTIQRMYDSFEFYDWEPDRRKAIVH